MIVGIGIDTVSVDRFCDYHKKPINQLLKVFSNEEIEYCLSKGINSKQHFAARFAAKEAFFKALSQFIYPQKLNLFKILESTSIMLKSGLPTIIVNWDNIPILPGNSSSSPISHVSLTHTESQATAFVILECTS